jgi:hypothetical protein
MEIKKNENDTKVQNKLAIGFFFITSFVGLISFVVFNDIILPPPSRIVFAISLFIPVVLFSFYIYFQAINYKISKKFLGFKFNSIALYDLSVDSIAYTLLMFISFLLLQYLAEKFVVVNEILLSNTIVYIEFFLVWGYLVGQRTRKSLNLRRHT